MLNFPSQYISIGELAECAEHIRWNIYIISINDKCFLKIELRVFTTRIVQGTNYPQGTESFLKR
jgi:hypothetical protein